jgi:hypothetical protein
MKSHTARTAQLDTSNAPPEKNAGVQGQQAQPPAYGLDFADHAFTATQLVIQREDDDEGKVSAMIGKLKGLAESMTPNESRNPIRLVVEGLGHLTIGSLVLGLGLVPSGLGVPVGLLAALLGGGQLVISASKFMRALLGTGKFFSKWFGMAGDKWPKITAALISLEGLVWAGSATLIGALTGGAVAIVSAIGGFIKLIRGIAQEGLAVTGSSGKGKKYMAILNIIESIFGAITGIAATAIAEGGAVAAGVVGTFASFVKGSRGAAGLAANKVTESEVEEEEQ